MGKVGDTSLPAPARGSKMWRANLCRYSSSSRDYHKAHLKVDASAMALKSRRFDIPVYSPLIQHLNLNVRFEVLGWTTGRVGQRKRPQS